MSGHSGYLSAQGAAAQLGVSFQTLAKLRVSGGGPRFIKLGARVLYDPTDLTSWLEGRKRSSTSDAGEVRP